MHLPEFDANSVCVHWICLISFEKVNAHLLTSEHSMTSIGPTFYSQRVSFSVLTIKLNIVILPQEYQLSLMCMYDDNHKMLSRTRYFETSHQQHLYA